MRAAAARYALAALLVAAPVAAPPAHAQGRAPAPGQAEFDYGLAEMQAGRYQTGCPSLAESYRLDPKPGVLFTLAECENQWGKLASALTHYEAYLDFFGRMTPEQKARQRGRDKISIAQRDALRRDAPRLAISPAPSAPPGSTVLRDGVVLVGSSVGELIPVDPGDHTLTLKTPSGATKEIVVTLQRGDQLRAQIPAPEPEPSPAATAAPPPVAAPPPSAPPTEAPAPASDEGSSSGHHTALISALAVGIVGVAVGAIGGIIVLEKKSTIDQNCVNEVCNSADNTSTANSAKTFGTLSTIGFAVGGAGLAAALVLWLTEPGRPASPAATGASTSRAVRIVPFAAPLGLGGGLGASGTF